jgi:hypothetical protein
LCSIVAWLPTLSAASVPPPSSKGWFGQFGGKDLEAWSFEPAVADPAVNFLNDLAELAPP